MAKKTVFISSTYKDLQEYRKAVWSLLPKFDVNVRGMEKFGARTLAPRDTCLAEVAQSDVYVGIIAFRLGTLDEQTKRSFTELEYERALETKKEIRIYLARDGASFPADMVDTGTKAVAQLKAFKKRLQENHTVGLFSDADELVSVMRSDLKTLFASVEKSAPDDDLAEEFKKSASAIREFLLTPARFNGTEVRLSVTLSGLPYAASRELCRQFNLGYGSTIGLSVKLQRPEGTGLAFHHAELFATGNNVDLLRKLRSEKNGELYAALRFCEEDVRKTHAEFLGYSYDPSGYDEPDDGSEWMPAEGKVILLFTKSA